MRIGHVDDERRTGRRRSGAASSASALAVVVGHERTDLRPRAARRGTSAKPRLPAPVGDVREPGGAQEIGEDRAAIDAARGAVEARSSSAIVRRGASARRASAAASPRPRPASAVPSASDRESGAKPSGR